MSEQLKRDVAERVGAMITEIATRWAATANTFATSAAWVALIDSLEALGAAFDAFGVMPRSTRSAGSEVTDPDQFGDALGSIVADVLITDGIVEAETADGCTLLIGAASVRALDARGAAAIADAIEDLQIRVIATGSGDRVQVSLRVGPERSELFALRLGESRIALKSDLPTARLALAQIGTVLLRRFRGHRGPALTLPRAQGRVSATLSLDGDRGFALELAVLQPFAIELYFGERPTLIRLDASKRTLSLRGDASRGQLHLSVNLGALHVITPDDQARVDIEVPGLQFDIDFATGAREVVLQKLGFGADTVELKRDGARVLAWQLAQNGPLDVRVQPRDDKGLAIGIPAGAGAVVEYAPEGGEAPTAAAGQLTVAIGAEGPAVIALPPFDAPRAGLRVETGTLTVDGGRGARPIRVPAGHRLVLRDARPGGEASLWSRLEAVSN